MNYVVGEFPNVRMRRLRSKKWIRDLVEETSISAKDLIYPMFVVEGQKVTQQISSLPGVERYSVDMLLPIAEKAVKSGIPLLALFPFTDPSLRTPKGDEALNDKNLVCRAVRAIKENFPEIGVLCDVALDPYTSHGHDGLLENGEIVNDKTIEVLCEQSLVQARAGCDVIAPSDMMDGRIGEIRKALDKEGFNHVSIMSYAAKFASCFYGPFRDAVGSRGVLTGDKKTYQMNPANTNEAMREVALDLHEGADMVMVKPGLPYLDIVYRVKNEFKAPTFAYHVSGEYALLKFAAEKNALSFNEALLEVMMSFKRAGADGVFTYGALEIAESLKK